MHVLSPINTLGALSVMHFDYIKSYKIWYYYLNLNRFPKKHLKTIGPPGKPEGNAAHMIHSAVSPKINFMGDYNTQVFAV
jgi:hypothetical protein